MTTMLRQSAEDIFAQELAALAKKDDRERPPNWKLSPQAVVTYVMGGKAADGTVIAPKICRQPAADRDGGCDARDRSRAASAWRAGDGEILGLRASGGGDLRHLATAYPVHRRHRRKSDPLRLELCAALGERTIA